MSLPTALDPQTAQELMEALPRMSAEDRAALLSDLEAMETQARKQRCRDSFLAFCAAVYPEWVEGPHHRFLAPKLEQVRDGTKDRMTVSMPPRFGKQLDHDTPVMTQNRGWVRHGDLVVGDSVFHPSGLPTKVVAISPEQEQDCEVETFDGAVIRCHENHEWTVYDRGNAGWRTVETKYLEAQRYLSGDRARFSLPLTHALQFPEVALPVDPYFLGVWLGNGKSCAPTICGAEKDMEHVVARIPHTRGAQWVHSSTGVVYQNFLGMTAPLRDLGVLNNKHIPAQYMRASEGQRRALLAGLVDTDGTQDKTGRIHYDGVNERLVKDVAALARSLGYRAGVIHIPQDMREREIKATCSAWRCYWTPHDGQGGGTLPRKVAYRVRARRQVGIKAIRRVAPTMGRCIQVDSGDGLYLAGEMLTPTHNSICISFLFVAWYLGHHPTHHIIMATHTATLSADFGRNVRNLIDSPLYREFFPDTLVSKDKSAADNWTTTLGGKYLAVGVGASLAGHGAHLLIIDDAVSEQAVLANPDTAFATAWEYIQVGPLQRLMPNGRIIMVATRWGKKDPIGRALQWAQQNPGSPPWDEVRFPALLPSGKSLWPAQWSTEELLAKKASMFPQFWAAQFQQTPTSEEGALIKREWWRTWEESKAPECEVIIQTWDTAHEAKNSADFSACTTWGVFYKENQVGEQEANIILLDAFKARVEFPELKKVALKHYSLWEPEALMVEKKAAGAPLIQELRRMGIPVMEFTPSRGNDKRARVNSVTDIFASGKVWAPDTRWAREVVDEVAEFPNAENDDFLDCTTMAMIRYRQGGFVTLPSDTADEAPGRRRRFAYY